MKAFLYSISIPIGVMFSPENLVLLGNSAGHNGLFFYTSLPIAAVVSCLVTAVLFHPRHAGAYQAKSTPLARFAGKIPATALILSTRLAVILLAATSVLVTAGFAFNEIFLYWFPNFGFAFLLLGLILICNLINERWGLLLQLALISFSLLGFGLLIFAGFFLSEPVFADKTDIQTVDFAAPAGAILLFLGFDLVTQQREGRRMSPALAAICTMLLLFLFWGTLSRALVPLNTLAESTLPHIKAARSILGQTGRLLIGAVIICGAAATVNGLFISFGETVNRLARQGMFPALWNNYNQLRLVYIILALITTILMMTGLAGEEELTVYYRGALVLWLILLTVRCLAVAGLNRGDSPRLTLLAIFSGCLLGGFTIALFLTAANAAQVAIFCVSAWAGGLVFALIWLGTVRLFPQLTHPICKEDIS